MIDILGFDKDDNHRNGTKDSSTTDDILTFF